jgi:hypothetical protein
MVLTISLLIDFWYTKKDKFKLELWILCWILSIGTLALALVLHDLWFGVAASLGGLVILTGIVAWFFGNIPNIDDPEI